MDHDVLPKILVKLTADHAVLADQALVQMQQDPKSFTAAINSLFQDPVKLIGCHLWSSSVNTLRSLRIV
jgi:hypothetical protein